MARHTVLTQRQREQVMALPHPDDTRLIARSYLFSEQDMQIIRQQDSDSNQFAFALHLCVLRYPGRIWQINEQLPEYLINLISEQLALPVSVLDNYQHDYGIRRSQLYRLRQQFGFRLFNDTTKQLLQNWMIPTALSTDKAIVLMNVLLSKMVSVSVNGGLWSSVSANQSLGQCAGASVGGLGSSSRSGSGW